MSRALDDITPAFRAACERWPDAPNLQQHYNDLARTWEGEGSSIVELTKSFLECVCWTVIKELNAKGPDSATPNTHQILRSALAALGLSNQRGFGPFDDLISGLNKLTKSIDDLRRNDGSVAHGKDAFVDPISSDVVRAYIAATDAIITTILRAFDGTDPNIRTTREPVTRWAHLNERINATTMLDAQVDEETGKMTVRIYCRALEEPIEMLLSPAELLYELYREAYVEVVQAIRSLPIREEETEPVVEEETEAAEALTEGEPTAPPESAPEPSRLQLLDEYQGRYRDKVSTLYEFVIHNLLNGNDAQAQQVLRFVNTLLAEMEKLVVVDWAKRPSARSRVKLYLKRLITLAGVEGLTIEQSQPLLEWLRREINSAGASQ